jgi:hypothetical protein
MGMKEKKFVQQSRRFLLRTPRAFIFTNSSEKDFSSRPRVLLILQPGKRPAI